MFISWLHFVAMLLLTGTAIRFVQITFPETAVGRALTVIY